MFEKIQKLVYEYYMPYPLFLTEKRGLSWVSIKVSTPLKRASDSLHINHRSNVYAFQPW